MTFSRFFSHTPSTIPPEVWIKPDRESVNARPDDGQPPVDAEQDSSERWHAAAKTLLAYVTGRQRRVECLRACWLSAMALVFGIVLGDLVV